MADRLDELEHEVRVELLEKWIDVYKKGQAAYDGFAPELRAWIDVHGHRVESFVPVVAFMQPDARVLCRALVEDAHAALSQAEHTIDPADETRDVGASRVENTYGGTAERMEALEHQLERIESKLEEVIRLLGAREGSRRSDAPSDRLDVRDL